MRPLALFAVLLALAPLARADVAAPTPAASDALAFRRGDIPLRDGLATLRLGESFKYLAPPDAEKVLQAWGNPPGKAGLGMLFAADASPSDPASWAVIVGYEEDGHVDDDDAAGIDYDALLAEMQAATEEANATRVKDGYGALHLIGWAEPPHYDAATHKLYWAKSLDFEGSERMLNYDIRVLGRKGVLSLSAVATLAQLDEVKKAMPDVLHAVEFNEGSRYADYVPSADATAAYGLAALVAGKAAAKLGFFALALKVLVASKKLVVAVVFGVGLLAKRFFARKRSAPSV